MVNKKKVTFFTGFEFNSWSQAIFCAAILFISIVATITITIKLAVAADAEKYTYENTTYYEVEQGDTLWTIACRYTTNEQDVRRVIDIIKDINDCNSTIYPGEWLEVPDFS